MTLQSGNHELQCGTKRVDSTGRRAVSLERLVALLGQVVDDLEDLLVAVSELHLVIVVSDDEGLGEGREREERKWLAGEIEKMSAEKMAFFAGMAGQI